MKSIFHKKNLITWLDSKSMRIDGVDFCVIEDLKDMGKESTGNQLLLAKTDRMVEKYLEISNTIQAPNILELGIFKGGSCAFFHKLFNPEKLVAIDHTIRPVPALEDYIGKNKCQGKIIPCYGVNQADQAKMLPILEREFPQKDIDLVIDDASHFLHETRCSFNLVFPYLHPGGTYIIEDWAWAHEPDDLIQKPDGNWSDRPALTTLIFEIIMTCPSQPGLIDEIIIDKHFALVKRGNLPIESTTFDISKSYLTRGKKFSSSL